MQLNRGKLNDMPNDLRTGIEDWLHECLTNAEKRRVDGATSFTVTLDESQRSAALIAQGEYNAYKKLYSIFKTK